MKKIYFDNAATTKIDEKVLKAMIPYFEKYYGNASSQHVFGSEAKNALEKSRRIIAKEIDAKASEIVFTSGGTESNNLALKGLFFENYPKKNHIVTTKIEHDCVLKTCKWLEKQGCRVTYLNVNEEGFIDLDELKNSITEKTFVVSIIHGNNEIGVVQDIEKIGEICKEKNVLFHTDACQSFTKVPINVKKQNVNLMTLNAHKIHGPKGVGALYIRGNGNISTNSSKHGQIREDVKIVPLFHGGGHERKLRSGTENIPGIVGFAEAVKVSNKKYVLKMEKLRDKLIDGLLEINDVKLNGSRENRLCNNVNVSFMNIEGEAVGGYLEANGILTSTGSACMSNTLESSHVLKALGFEPLRANSSLRISLSKYNNEEEVDYFLKKISGIVKKLRRFSPLR